MDFLLGDRTVIAHKSYIQKKFQSFLTNCLIELFEIQKIKRIWIKSLKQKSCVIKWLFIPLDIPFASQLVIDGAPIYTVQKLMNHKDLKMTMRYAKQVKIVDAILLMELFNLISKPLTY